MPQSLLLAPKITQLNVTLSKKSFLFLFFGDQISLSHSGTITAHCSLRLLGSSDFPPSASQVAGNTGVPPHPANFELLVEMGFHYVGKAGL